MPYPVVALVGYTNAGKSTLFNRLTRAEVAAEDMLFATLDPTMRRARAADRPQGDPVRHGRLYLRPADPSGRRVSRDAGRGYRPPISSCMCATSPIPDSEAQRADVDAVLRDLGLDAARDDGLIEVLNKIDLLDSGARNALLAQAARNDHMQAVSALSGEGLDELFGLLDRHMTADRVTVDLCVRIEDGAALAWLHDRGDVLERHDDEEFAHLSIALDKADLARFESRYDYHPAAS